MKRFIMVLMLSILFVSNGYCKENYKASGFFSEATQFGNAEPKPNPIPQPEIGLSPE